VFRKQIRVEAREMSDWYLPPSDLVRQIVEKQYRAEDRPAIIDALATILSESTREAILVLAYGDAARLLRLVEADHNDWRNISCLIQQPGRELGLPGGPLVGGVDREEWKRRCRELGLPVPLRGDEFDRLRLEDAVKGFISAELLFPYGQLLPTTRLNYDLGLSGSEGSKFMTAFAERFGVDIRDFRPEFYFPPKRGEHLAADLLKYVFGKRDCTVVPITIADLTQAAGDKKWKSTELQ
jgi:hypothetical protein